MSSFLAKNAGTPDILDRLLDHFGSSSMEQQNMMSNSSTLRFATTSNGSPTAGLFSPQASNRLVYCIYTVSNDADDIS